MPENVNTSVLSIGQANDAKDHREVMVKVDHVSMSFNMASEQLNSLKEYAIAIAKHKLFFEEFKALDDVSFEVRKGDVFGIMGTNGSGKSTMLKIIAGVLDPSKGSCQVNGKIAPLIELGAGFDMDLTARENIYLNGALLGYSKEFIDENFEDIVEFAEIRKFLDMPLKNYSSGMVARIAFAIATVIIPDILLVDEVLSVGDFMFQKKCEDRIKTLIEEHGVTVLIVSHSNEQIARLCNRAIWIEKGHARLIGKANDVAMLYGSLGGRLGSAESERRVFDAVKPFLEGKTKPSYDLIAGQDHIGTNARVFQRCGFQQAKQVVLVSNRTHANAVVAQPLAAALGAPLLVTAADVLPEITERHLSELAPSEILFFDSEKQSEHLIAELKGLPSHPAVTYFCDNEANMLRFSAQVYHYGKERGLWGPAPSLVDFDDNPESLAATVFFRCKKSPALVFKGAKENLEGLGELLSADKVHAAYAFGATACTALPDSIDHGGNSTLISKIYGANVADTCLKICETTLSLLRKGASESSPLFVSSLSNAQWQEHLACAQLAEQEHAPFLLIDKTNLDGISASLDFIHNNRESFSSLTFIGGDSCLSSIDRALFSNELKL